MFEYGCMSSPAPASLQHRIDEMQSLRLDERTLPTAGPLRPLLPGGRLRMGAAYAVHGSATLGLALLAEASTAGEWCGIVGAPDLHPEAAARLGVALDRCALVPRPGARALSVASTLAETLSLVLVYDISTPAHRDAARLAAKLRDSGAALIVLGDWPRAESELRVTASRWSGLGHGSGVLRSRELTIRSQDRRGLREHRVHLETGRLSEPESTPQPAGAAPPAPGFPRPVAVAAPTKTRERVAELTTEPALEFA